MSFSKNDITTFSRIKGCGPGINTGGSCKKRPKMPSEWLKNRREWLSNFDIDDVMKEYENLPDVRYLGAVPIDFDKDLGGYCVVQYICDMNVESDWKKGIRKYALVINLDTHDKGGSHWVSMFVDLNKAGIYFFDSYGFKPETEIQKFMERMRIEGNGLIEKGHLIPTDDHAIPLKIQKISDYNIRVLEGDKNKIINNNFLKIGENIFKIVKINKTKTILTLENKIPDDIYETSAHLVGFRTFYNNNRFQYKSSECGVYSMYFITELIKGRSFKEVITHIVDDDNINKARLKYYDLPSSDSKKKSKKSD
jgi:hypothetical protein